MSNPILACMAAHQSVRQFSPEPLEDDQVRQAVQAAQRAAEFIWSTMIRDDGRLLHAFRGGQAHLDGYVDDYAYTIDAFIGMMNGDNLGKRLVRVSEDPTLG